QERVAGHAATSWRARLDARCRLQGLIGTACRDDGGATSGSVGSVSCVDTWVILMNDRRLPVNIKVTDKIINILIIGI
ncbi:MAG: hypothetical protein OEY27_03990, partial [Gammaproteobacteria bacterium]|nr:hypothetical protein [Gammaproteobacteria bacterium]